jgi:hypothetical protein
VYVENQMRKEFLFDAKFSHVMNTMLAKMRSLKNEKYFFALWNFFIGKFWLYF